MAGIVSLWSVACYSDETNDIHDMEKQSLNYEYPQYYAFVDPSIQAPIFIYHFLFCSYIALQHLQKVSGRSAA